MTRWKTSVVSVMIATGIVAMACEPRGSDAEAKSSESQAVRGADEERKPPSQPKEALKACEGLEENAECTVPFDGGSVEGTCKKGRDGQGELACVPSRPHGPPPGERPNR